MIGLRGFDKKVCVFLEVCQAPRSACVPALERERKRGRTHNPTPMEAWVLRGPVLVEVDPGSWVTVSCEQSIGGFCAKGDLQLNV